MPEILRAENIFKSFGDHIALDNVSISIPEGSIFGLLGPNGAGKTTLIRIITQIITMDRGKIFIKDKFLAPHHIKIIGYLPEERGLYKKMRVGEQLLYLTRLRGIGKIEATKRIKYWLEKFDISKWTNKNVEDLSKGMQQKVQFIATVIHQPELIILDEPFSGFDPINANLIKDEILQLKDKGRTIIFSTHRMESVEELCDYITLIDRSKKILDGPKNQIKEDFKTNTYLVEHSSPIESLSSDFELVNCEKTEESYFKSTIKIINNSTPGKLIHELNQKSEIQSFNQRIPSINDIFISKVKDNTNHE